MYLNDQNNLKIYILQLHNNLQVLHIYNNNLEFLIDVWAEVIKEVSDSILLMIGGTDIDMSKKYEEAKAALFVTLIN